MAIEITDMHMHVVPGIDDGAKTLEESLEMLRSAYNQGARMIFCTSHQWGEGMANYEKNFNLLAEAVYESGMDLLLCPANEVLFTRSNLEHVLDCLDTDAVLSLAGTRYVLTEFYPDEGFDFVSDAASALISRGYKPVIAHAERINKLELDNYKELVEKGCFLQVNFYSFVEEKHSPRTKEIARALLDNKLISFLGSDAHRLDHRPPNYESGIDYVLNNCDEDYAEKLLCKNGLLVGSIHKIKYILNMDDLERTKLLTGLGDDAVYKDASGEIVVDNMADRLAVLNSMLLVRSMVEVLREEDPAAYEKIMKKAIKESEMHDIDYDDF